MRRLLISLLVILIGAVTLWQRQAETVPPVAATNVTPRKGRIAFQSEGAEIFLRRWELFPLK